MALEIEDSECVQRCHRRAMPLPGLHVPQQGPTFRAATHKAVIRALLHTQGERSRDTFEDRGVEGIDSGYSQEEFLQMQGKLLLGAKKAP